MEENPYDPRKRTNLTENEQRALRFMTECLHGYWPGQGGIAPLFKRGRIQETGTV
jgi:hypothetical protein